MLKDVGRSFFGLVIFPIGVNTAESDLPAGPADVWANFGLFVSQPDAAFYSLLI